MKKSIALITAMLMLLTSCVNAGTSDTDTPGDSTVTPTGGSVTSYSIDLDSLNYNPQPGVVDSTLRHTADVTTFKTRDQVADFLTAPYSFIDGEYTYIFRIFPEKFTAGDEYYAYVDGDERENFGVEIYKNHDYSAPAETVYLEGFEGKRYSPKAFSYDPETDGFHVLTNENIGGEYTLFLYSFDRNGKLLDSAEVDRSGNEEFLIFGGRLYSVKNGGNSKASGKLICSDPFAGTEETLADSALCVFVSENTLYYIKNVIKADYTAVYVLCSYDPDTGKETEITEIDTAESIASAAYDAENGILYYSDLNNLIALQNGERKTVLTTCDTMLDVQYIRSGQLTLMIGHNQLAVYMLEENPESLNHQKVVLKICCLGDDTDPGNLYADTIEIMNAVGLQVEFEITFESASTDEYVSTMAKKFLSGDSDFDLFIVEPGMTAIMESEYYADLSQFSVLADRYDHMIGGMKELMLIDEKTALMPSSITVNGIAYTDPSYAEIYSAPESFDGLFTSSADLPDDLYLWTAYSEYNLFEIWFNELASNFMSRTVTNEQAEEAMLKLFETAADMKNNPNIYIGSDYQDKKSIFRYKNSGGSADLLPISSLGDGYKNSANGSFIAVNEKSPNKSLAAAFLAYYCHAAEDWEGRNLYYTDKAEKYMAYTEKYTDNTEAAADGYEVFKKQIENSIRRTDADGFGSEMIALCRSVAEGEITPDKAAEQAMRYLKMVRDE